MIIDIAHLRVNATQSVEVAVGIGGVSAGGSIEESVDGAWCLSHVAIGAAEEVVGADLLVGCAVAVEEVGGGSEEGVGGQLGVGTVKAVGLVEEGEHLPSLRAVAGGEEHEQHQAAHEAAGRWSTCGHCGCKGTKSF